MQLPIYLDYAATTPVDQRVADKMARYLTVDGIFGNPASRSHIYGWQAEEAVETARRQVADLINADPREIVWTSGATESDNLALKGVARQNAGRGRHIVTSAIEHKAVLDTCAALEREGFEVSYLTPGSDGIVTLEQIAGALREDTVLVSLMHANNEIGTLNDIGAIGALCRERDIPFHTDAAQSAGKLPLDVKAMQLDLVSLSAHKMYGPKGIGALYVRRQPKLELQAQIHGGGHERGMRSGTLPTHQIVGMGEAAAIAAAQLEDESVRIGALRQRFFDAVSELEQLTVHGDLDRRLPGNLNLSFAGVDGEALLMALKDVAVSSGSACTSASLEPSYVLRALGVPEDVAHTALRFSFGRFTSEADVDRAAAHVRQTVSRLRERSRAHPAGQVVSR